MDIHDNLFPDALVIDISQTDVLLMMDNIDKNQNDDGNSND